MNWEEIRVGYSPYHKELSAPGDRRRFVFYAKERKINFHLADPLIKYDIVYLTYGCNLSIWIKYKKNNPNVRIVFELIDSYLLEDISLTSIFRGTAWYFLGREENLWLNYKSALRKMLSICDAVVCSTDNQKLNILKFNKNIHVSLDYFSNDIVHFKNSFQNQKRLKLVWEGQAYTVENLLLLNDVFNKLNDKIELYIITDPFIKSPIRYIYMKTNSKLKKLSCKYHFKTWDLNSFSEIISSADLALIPIRSDNSMMWNKPENKLLLLWEIGIPVLTTDTPNYKRVMDEAGIDFYCLTLSDWTRKIENYIESSLDYRVEISTKMRRYIEKFHTKDKILKNWDMIFDSLNH